MKISFVPLLLAALAAGLFFAGPVGAATKPLRVLLVLGGCCHDYDTQRTILKQGIEARLNAVVEVAYNPDKSTKATFEVYRPKDWAQGFDVVIHNECSADVTDSGYVANILQAHRSGLPAVNLHCAMHSYRWGNFREPVKAGSDNAAWFEFLGLQSSGHGPQEPIDITYTDTTHPITRGLENWTTIKEELYNNVQILGGKPLASGRQMQMPRAPKGQQPAPNARPVEATAVVAWTNEYGPNKTRVFSTTIGHNNDTVADPRYLDLVSRALLWTTGKLNDNGQPAAGYAK